MASAVVRGATVPGRWVDAGDLRVGDVLLLKPDRRVAIEEILVRQVAEKVYNFQVAALHNYAVGPDHVLVHNNCGASSSGNIDPNKLHHIFFAKPLHKLGPLAKKFGSEEAAFKAVQKEINALVKQLGLTGVFEDIVVTVGGHQIGVSGRVMDDLARIGTFYALKTTSRFTRASDNLWN